MQHKQTDNTNQMKSIDTDVTTWELPEGAIARLGQGIIADIAFSLDNKSLAVATTIGVWIYELATMKPKELLETERGWFLLSPFLPMDNGLPPITGTVSLRYGRQKRNGATPKYKDGSAVIHNSPSHQIANTSLHLATITVALMYGTQKPVCTS